jgi:transitional endoplasmic reticulum ATPase
MAATREFIDSVDPEEAAQSVGNVRVTADHFETALEEVGASVDDDTRERYEEIEEEFTPGTEPDDRQVSRTFQ